VPLEQAPHLGPGRHKIANERLAIALDQPKVDEGDRKVRVRIDLAWRGPAQLAAGLRLRRPVERTGAKQVNEEVKASGGRASHLVQGDGSQVAGAIACLLEELASRGVLETLVSLHVPARQEPRTGERTGGLLDDQDTSGVIDASDHRADSGVLPRRGALPLGPFGHARYGVFFGVGKGGSVPVGKPIVGVAPGVRVGTGVRVGVGDPEGVGHGSGPTRFHV